MDHVRRHILEGCILKAHGRIKREAPDILVSQCLLPLGLSEVALHEREHVALVRLDNAVEPVESLAVVMLGDIIIAVLIADKDPRLLGLHAHRLVRLNYLCAPALRHLLYTNPVTRGEQATDDGLLLGSHKRTDKLTHLLDVHGTTFLARLSFNFFKKNRVLVQVIYYGKFSTWWLVSHSELGTPQALQGARASTT